MVTTVKRKTFSALLFSLSVGCMCVYWQKLFNSAFSARLFSFFFFFIACTFCSVLDDKRKVCWIIEESLCGIPHPECAWLYFTCPHSLGYTGSTNKYTKIISHVFLFFFNGNETRRREQRQIGSDFLECINICSHEYQFACKIGRKNGAFLYLLQLSWGIWILAVYLMSLCHLLRPQSWFDSSN